jgi:hypothetical protein
MFRSGVVEVGMNVHEFTQDECFIGIGEVDPTHSRQTPNLISR